MTPGIFMVSLAAVILYGTLVYANIFVQPQPVPISVERSR